MGMGDLKLQRRDDGIYDLAFVDGDLQLGKSLESAALVSVGSLGRGAEKAFKKDLQDDGWWAEPTIEGDVWGCLVHTLTQVSKRPNRELLAVQYVKDSLRWLVDDGVADSVDAAADVTSEYLVITVHIEKGGERDDYRYEILWNEVA